MSEKILLIQSEMNAWDLPFLSNALSGVGYQVMIMDISEIESVVTWYIPALAIARLPGHPGSDLKLCHLLMRLIRGPVIAISSHDDVESRIAALDAGVEDYLVSPVNPIELVVRVKNILHRR